MTNNTEDLDEMIKMSQLNLEKLNSDALVKVEKVRTIIRFNTIKREHPDYNQSAICTALGISVSTLERIRRDLSLPSPYRYTISDKTEAQKDKAKLKQKVYMAHKKGLITEETKQNLYDKINTNIDKSVKEEVSNLKTLPKLQLGSTSDKSSRRSKRGGAIETELVSNSNSVNNPTVNISSLAAANATALAEKYLKEM